jgi:hypothetical protein
VVEQFLRKVRPRRRPSELNLKNLLHLWTIGVEDCNCLRAFDGETGARLYSGEGPDQMALVRGYETPIAANGRIFVAADNRLYAFVPGGASE